jgi:hypothetical protein
VEGRGKARGQHACEVLRCALRGGGAAAAPGGCADGAAVPEAVYVPSGPWHARAHAHIAREGFKPVSPLYVARRRCSPHGDAAPGRTRRRSHAAHVAHHDRPAAADVSPVAQQGLHASTLRLYRLDCRCLSHACMRRCGECGVSPCMGCRCSAPPSSTAPHKASSVTFTSTGPLSFHRLPVEMWINSLNRDLSSKDYRSVRVCTNYTHDGRPGGTCYKYTIW